jgi:hypothetical protein
MPISWSDITRPELRTRSAAGAASGRAASPTSRGRQSAGLRHGRHDVAEDVGHDEADDGDEHRPHPRHLADGLLEQLRDEEDRVEEERRQHDDEHHPAALRERHEPRPL